MSLVNITYDDFDPPIIYSNPTDWTTPNPQDNPSWFNSSSDLTGSIWNQATYHSTQVVGTKVSLNFTGSEVYIYGASGPSYGDYSVTLDPTLASPYMYNGSAYATNNGTERFLLFNMNGLAYAQHEVVVETKGGLLLDMIQVGGTEVGAEGSTLTNTTLDDSSPLITYTGSWTTNQLPLFYGGSSIYTSTPGDSLSFNFSGSAFYLYGDQVNDHGLFSIYVNDTLVSPSGLSGASGCGAQEGKNCEKLGGLFWAQTGLGEGEHRVKVVNDGSGGTPYFDFDYLTYTTPSAYSTRQLSTNHTCPFSNCDTSTSTPSSNASGSATGNPTSSPSPTQTSGAGRRATVPGIFNPLGLVASWFVSSSNNGRTVQAVAQGASSGEDEDTRHTNNWAVLVCTSRYWFNYRHMANTLGMYRTVKRLGIPDSQIILMLADDVACNPRNEFPGAVYANSGRKLDLYGSGVGVKNGDTDSGGKEAAVGVEVDYRGYEVSVESFLRVLTGRHPESLPASKRLLSDASSNIFVYLTGHGGDEFLKFQDNEEVGAHDIGDAINQMWEKKRYNKLFFMTDTCQANTLYKHIYSPNVLATGSSALGENSYSHHNDPDIGVAVIDSYTHHALQYLEGIGIGSNVTMRDFFDNYDPIAIKSHPGIFTDHFPHPLEDVLVTDFFGGLSQAEVDEVLSVGTLSLELEVEVPLRAVVGTGESGEGGKRERLLTRQGYVVDHDSAIWTRLGGWVGLIGMGAVGIGAWAISG